MIIYKHLNIFSLELSLLIIWNEYVRDGKEKHNVVKASESGSSLVFF